MSDRTTKDIDQLQARLKANSDEYRQNRAGQQSHEADQSLPSAADYAKQIINTQMNDRTATPRK